MPDLLAKLEELSLLIYDIGCETEHDYEVKYNCIEKLNEIIANMKGEQIV